LLKVREMNLIIFKLHNFNILHVAVGEGTEITFTSPKPMYPLPDPRYLALHATVAKVVHTAGIDNHLDDILEKYEDIRVLSDESDLEYLDGLLRVAQTDYNQQPIRPYL
jgi:hypothetical protein